MDPTNSNLQRYIAEIQEYPLLSRQEEIDIGRKAFKKNKKARDILVKHNLRLVVKVANDFNFGTVDILDLINEGNIGLQKAAERFNPDRPGASKFSTYAVWWIKQAIKRYLGNHSRLIRLPIHQNDKLYKCKKAIRRLEMEGVVATPDEIAAETGIPIDKVRKILAADLHMTRLEAPINGEDSSTFQDVIADESITNAGEESMKSEESQIIADIISYLSPREQLIIKARYGLNGRDRQTLETLGIQLKLTRERVRQIEAAARAKLRRLYERHLKGLAKGQVGSSQVNTRIRVNKVKAQESKLDEERRKQRRTKLALV